jgi:hypothetical protein
VGVFHRGKIKIMGGKNLSLNSVKERGSHGAFTLSTTNSSLMTAKQHYSVVTRFVFLSNARRAEARPKAGEPSPHAVVQRRRMAKADHIHAPIDCSTANQAS